MRSLSFHVQIICIQILSIKINIWASGGTQQKINYYIKTLLFQANTKINNKINKLCHYWINLNPL
jgi:hypothetical protein